MQLTRRTGDRHRDIDPKVREDVIAWLQDHSASQHLIGLVDEGGQLDAEEQQQAFGESLPKGLQIK